MAEKENSSQVLVANLNISV